MWVAAVRHPRGKLGAPHASSEAPTSQQRRRPLPYPLKIRIPAPLELRPFRTTAESEESEESEESGEGAIDMQPERGRNDGAADLLSSSSSSHSECGILFEISI